MIKLYNDIGEYTSDFVKAGLIHNTFIIDEDSWTLTRSWLPRKCRHTRKLLWLKIGYRRHIELYHKFLNVSVSETIWLSKNAGLIILLKGE